MPRCAAARELPTELWIKVFCYLPHIDLQQVRLVSKCWRWIADLPEFLSQTRLRITAQNLSEISARLSGNGETLPSVPHAELDDVRCAEELLHVLSRFGKHVRSLTVQKKTAFGCINGSNLPQLRELHIRYLLAAVDDAVVDVAWQQLDLNSFPKLRALSLMWSCNSRQRQHSLLLQLTAECSTLQLRQFSVQHMREDEEELLLQVLEAHAATLTQLSLNFLCPPRLSDAWRRVFQQLQQLEQISLCGKCRGEWLEAAFHSLPSAAPLQQVDLNGLLEATDALVELVAQKWSHTLQQLELMFCVQISDGALLQLAHLSDNLRLLNLAFCRKVTKHGLLKGIASRRNSTLRELRLSDLQQLDEECVCALAQRLPNLVMLSLNNCSQAVTDKALGHIFRHQTRLQHLLLDDCIRISDAGLLGCTELPYPISRLRGLQTLSLRNCSNLSNYAMHALQFQELRTLQLGYCHKISVVGIATLVINCPTLENLVISSCLMLDDECILHIARGLRRLRRLNVSNCLNITEHAVDYIVALCYSLQELTMCGIDSWEVCDVQKRLLQVKPQLKELHL